MEVSSLPQGRGFSLSASRRLLATLGDDRLVDQIRRGNSAAFEVVYDRYQAPLLSFCRHMLGSREEAEDALQQTFVSAHRDLLGTRKRIELRPWLYTIARNRSVSMLRARREVPDQAIEPSTVGLPDAVQQRDELRELVGDLGELPEEQRTALLLAELQDLPHVEIATVIGCEARKVKSLIYQARSGLIERREARETPCEEIREQLSALRGGALRRGPLRRHLKACPGCSAFRAQVKEQRRQLAAILPVIPSAGLKQGVLAAVGIGGGTVGGSGLAAGGAAIGGAGGDGGGVLGGALAAGGAVKLGVAAIVAGAVAVGGAILPDDDEAATAHRSGDSSGKAPRDRGRGDGALRRGGRSGVLGVSEAGSGAGRGRGHGSEGGGSSQGSSSAGGLGDGSDGGGPSGVSNDSVGSGVGGGSGGGGGLGHGSDGSGGNGQGSPPPHSSVGGVPSGGKDEDKDNSGNHTGHQQGQGHQEHGNGQGNGHGHHDHDRLPSP